MGDELRRLRSAWATEVPAGVRAWSGAESSLGEGAGSPVPVSGSLPLEVHPLSTHREAAVHDLRAIFQLYSLIV